MSRITKELAKNITENLTKDKLKQRNDLVDKISEKVRNEIINGIPKEIMDFFKKYPEYCKKVRSVQLLGNGTAREWISLHEDVPSKNGNTICHNCSPEFGKEISLLIQKKEKANTDLKGLKLSIETALLSLRTFKNVRIQFPEAIPFLPAEGSTSLPMINLDAIRKSLK